MNDFLEFARSRRKAGVVLFAAVMLFLALLANLGAERTWRLWNIPTMTPAFADLRTIAHGAEAVAMGLDPMVDNPGDPWHRPLNYPRIWQAVYLFGVDASHTFGIAIAIACFFLGSLVVLLRNADNLTMALIVCALFSPAVLLGVERGNIDLVVFALVMVAVVLSQKSVLAAEGTLFFAAALKLYPAFGLPLVLKCDRRRFIRNALVFGVVVLIYGLCNWSDLLLISRATPRASFLSYGLNVFWMRMESINGTLGTAAHWVCIFSVFVGCALALAKGLQVRRCMAGFDNGSLFRAGACIYIGTFLLGNNWEYRLVFLILCIPQLSCWLRENGLLRTRALATTVAMYVSMWHLMIIKCAGAVSRLSFWGHSFASVLPGYFDELANWALLFLLFHLFVATLPHWAKGTENVNDVGN